MQRTVNEFPWRLVIGPVIMKTTVRRNTVSPAIARSWRISEVQTQASEGTDVAQQWHDKQLKDCAKLMKQLQRVNKALEAVDNGLLEATESRDLFLIEEKVKQMIRNTARSL